MMVAARVFEFRQGESNHTENSHKCSIQEFLALAENGGFVSERVWTDDDKLFSVHRIRCVH
jgi:uncharacterized SAM-dependent methyltransferase